MAAVTLGTPANQRFDIGNLIERIYVVNGASGSTLNTNMIGIVWADVQSFTQAGTASLVTAMTVNAVTGLLTFTSSAPMVNEVVLVQALKG